MLYTKIGKKVIYTHEVGGEIISSVSCVLGYDCACAKHSKYKNWSVESAHRFSVKCARRDWLKDAIKAQYPEAFHYKKAICVL